MQKFLKEYLEGLNERREKRRKAKIAELLLVVLVIGAVAGILSQYGVAMTDREKCGLAEHKHNGACYENTLVCGMKESDGHEHTDECYETAHILSCGLDETDGHQHGESCYDEEGNLICDKKEMEAHDHTDSCYMEERTLVCQEKGGEGHIHTDACYEQKLVCGMEEHGHADACYVDKNIDVEEASEWDAMYKDTEWRDTWNENLVIAAQKQIGYRESKDNYEVAEDGSHKGYTRYGAFCEDAYCDWDAAFVNFCMHYAGEDDINIEASKMFPGETDTEKWYEEFIKADENNKDFLMEPADYEPKAGDLIFFERKDQETPVQMGIVSFYDTEKNEIRIIEGNSTDEVQENTYKIKEDAFGGDVLEKDADVTYLNLAAVEEAYKLSLEAAAQNEEEEIRELTTEVDDTVITLSGPVSSFEEGKEYTLQAEKVENEKTIATVEEAIDQVAEEKGATVDNYQAFDIKLMLDDEEVQPLGPVSVKFSGKEIVKSVENEETEVNVIHVDENTGETTDMEAVATEESDVVIETEHFSVYVYIEFGGIEGVDVNIQHWGDNIETIDDEPRSEGEIAFDVSTGTVVTKAAICQLYATDYDFHLPNETYIDIKNLSKVHIANSSGYRISKIWVSEAGKSNKCVEKNTWPEDAYQEYSLENLEDDSVTDQDLKDLASGLIKEEDLVTKGRIEIGDELEDGSVIRFWYEPIVNNEEKIESVTFYDYDFTDGKENVNGEEIYRTEERGINSSVNFANNGKPKLGVGQRSSGNASSWINNKNGSQVLNGRNGEGALKNIVKSTLVNGRLEFIDAIDAPCNLFSTEDPNKKGSTEYTNYGLGFSQKGDTYTLENVYKKKTGTDADGEPQWSLTTGARNLTTFQSKPKWNSNIPLFSNEFWPLDDVTGAKDPLMGAMATQKNIKLRDNNGNIPKADPPAQGSYGNPIVADFPDRIGKDHNYFFGMTYEVKFTVGDYTGPMNYYFRGDDDFWLFLDGELVVDLGGIHAALSDTCDVEALLKAKVKSGEKSEDWLKGEHTLNVFYMERGASGSCCYMQFTLPRVEIKQISTPSTTTYTVEKEWEDNENGFRPQEIKISLYKQKGDSEGVKVPGKEITLPLQDENGNPVWTYTWNDLPEKDGKFDIENKYYAKEEFIAPENQENPMLGYTCEAVPMDDGTRLILKNYIEDKKIRVHKEWTGDEREEENRPDSVVFQLYANGDPYEKLDHSYAKVTLNEGNGWTADFDHVPEYYYKTDPDHPKGGTWEKVTYSVKEVSDSNEKGVVFWENGKGAIYQVEVVSDKESHPIEDQDGKDISDKYIACFKVTNTLVSKNVCLEKVSKNIPDTKLAGAVFELYKEGDFKIDEVGESGNASPQGISIESLKETATPSGIYKTGENGRIDIQGLRFYPTAENPSGTAIYYLVETKAPKDYFLTEVPIKIVVNTDGVTVDFQRSDWDNNHISFGEGKYTIQIPNEMIYELPSAGGNGIYLYMFGGVLLMLSAALLAYKNKRKEVLRS